MAESENGGKPYSSPPPSYEDVVYGNQQRDQNATLPGIHSPHPSAPPVISHSQSHHGSQELQPSYPVPQPHPHPYFTSQYHMCPPGAEPILYLDEILVYPSSGWSPVYKIKDRNKVVVLAARWKLDGDCCDSWCFPTSRFILFSADNRLIAQAQSIDDNNCWSSNKKHMEVMGAPDIPFGTVRINSHLSCQVVNQSGDLLFSITKKHAWWQYHPFEVFSPSGVKVGQIDSSRGIKNRLTMALDIPAQHKILLIFFTLYVQRLEDSRRRR